MKKFILGIGLLFLVGCSSTQPTATLSPMQIRQISTKDFNGNYKQVMKATVVVLQDQGYIIQNTDYDTGLIFAEKDVAKKATATEMLGVFFVGNEQQVTKGAKIKATATVEEKSSEVSEVRFNAQQVDVKGNTFGDSMGVPVAIQDPNVYKSLFDQITVEVERIKAKI